MTGRPAQGGDAARSGTQVRVLVVDDDPSITASVGLLLRQTGFEVDTAASPPAALEALAERRPDVVLQDMNYSRDTSGEEGLALLASIRERAPDLPVVLMTAWASIDLAVTGMRAGAADFVTKPWSNRRLIDSLETALSLARVRPVDSESPSRRSLESRLELGDLVGESPAFLGALALVDRVAATEASVLVTGESGTGKELIAEAIHRNSRRSQGPFVKVNLGGMSSTLFESEMFGHVRGAFTDAKADRRGRFALADGGTIFLDEIGDLDSGSQVKLLRVLQDRTFEVLGSSRTRSVDVRVVSATHADLGQRVQEGEFREDLLYRVNLISIRLPPLRDRVGDVRLLAQHCLERARREHSRPELSLTEDAMAWLEAQRWPGNVRQLQQTIERAVLVLPDDSIRGRDLEGLDESEAQVRSGELPPPGSMTLEEMERAMIVRALGHYRGNLTRVAEALGLSRGALYRRLEKHGLEPPH